MIDIIGNIKIDETKPERVKMLIACIRSYAFLKDTGCTINIALHDASKGLHYIVEKEINDLRFEQSTIGGLSFSSQYGGLYIRLIFNRQNHFVLNFMEDQFMMLDNPNVLMHLIGFMKQYKVDVCKASFYQVEQNSRAGINYIADVPGLAMAYKNNPANHTAYCRYYGDRYYIGVNFLTTRQFALSFWNRQLGPRPHPYELPAYDPAWEHVAAIPGIELQAAIDDDHGEPGSCLLHRPDAKKFWDIYNTL